MTPFSEKVILNSVTVTFSTLKFIICRIAHQYNKFRLRDGKKSPLVSSKEGSMLKVVYFTLIF